MVGDDYTQCFVRDCNGSHLWMLDTGHRDEVRRSLEFFFRMDAHAANFSNSYRLDSGESLAQPQPPYWFERETGSGEPDEVAGQRGERDTDKQEDQRWTHITPGDVPNFRVLWYWWYHLRTGDLDLIAERWSYLRALIRLQKFERYGYLAGYSRDETYGIGPVDKLRRGSSADNSFIALAAVRALASMAERLGKNDESCELAELADNIGTSIEEKLWAQSDGLYGMRITPEGELDPRACSPGLLRPLWVGALGSDSDRAATSAEYVLARMMLSPGFIRIIPGTLYTTTGHLPAYLLVNMCKLDHPRAEQTFRELMSYVCPSGLCGEYYDQDSPVPRVQMHRARNWETGVNADAVLYYLTGFEPDAYLGQFGLKPHLPSGWGGFKVANMPVGQSRLDLEVAAAQGALNYRVSNRGDDSAGMSARFVLPPSWSDASLRVDGRTMESTVEVSRYSVRVVPWQMDIPPGGAANVELREKTCDG